MKVSIHTPLKCLSRLNTAVAWDALVDAWDFHTRHAYGSSALRRVDRLGGSIGWNWRHETVGQAVMG